MLFPLPLGMSPSGHRTRDKQIVKKNARTVIGLFSASLGRTPSSRHRSRDLHFSTIVHVGGRMVSAVPLHTFFPLIQLNHFVRNGQNERRMNE